jgi:hypothetical protein
MLFPPGTSPVLLINTVRPKSIPGDSDDPEIGIKSVMGTDVYDSVTFGGSNTLFYVDNEGNDVDIVPIQFTTVLVNAVLTNNIIETSMQGGEQIEEFISTENWQLTFDIIIDNGNIRNVNVRPVSEIRTILNTFKSTESVEVISEYLNDVLGITELTFRSFRIPQMEGQRNLTPIQIICKSSVSADVRLQLEE